MKNLILLTGLLLASSCAMAQFKKDGTPDMRYSGNKQMYGNSYSTPSYGSTSPSIGYQQSYQRNGTQVEGSYHTQPNSTNTDNWGTRGNNNPLTGSEGTRARDYSNEAANYGQGRTIETGPRGGQSYTNSNGNRTYVPKQPY